MRTRAVAAADSSIDRAQAATRWLVGAVVGVVILVASYALAVWTRAGQALENAALRGADQVAERDLVSADVALNAITVWSLAGATVLVAAIALIRRRVELAIAGVGTIVLGQVLAQGLKRFVLPRPPLVDVVGDFTHNSFPSGHTTIAMTVIFALVIVVPYRWRGVTVFFAGFWAIGIGAFTITAKWHRLSDTLGAMSIALLCACLASLWLARRGRVAHHTGRALPGRVILVAIISVVSVTSLGIGSVLRGIGVLDGVDFTVADETWEYNAYLGAHAIAAGAAGVFLLVFWGLWYRREPLPASFHDDTVLRDLS